MHEELNAPDPVSGGVGSGSDGPWWELLGEGADVWPFPGAGEGGGGGCCFAEGGEFGGG